MNKISINNMLGNLDGNLGEDDYSEPLEILVDSANKNNEFNLFGSIAFKNQLKNRLKMRSKLYEYIKDKDLPDISDPIFVTGLPRSGTTFLFNLLALDENHRSPKYWEIMSPLPLIKNKFDITKREWKINAELKFARTIIPKLKSMHHIRAQSPEECELLATINIRSFVYMCMADVPEYIEYLKNCSFETVFLWHKRFFQVLELYGKPKRWLFKDPSHIGHIPEIMHAYPNAKFINIHRNPEESIGSFCSLVKNIRSAFTKNADFSNIGKDVAEFWSNNLNKGMNDRNLLASSQIIDISYSDFIKNPLVEVKRIYTYLDLDFDIKTENKIHDYLVMQKKIKKNKHKYELEEFKLDATEIKKHFKNYMLNFNF